MHREVFAEHVVVADAQARRLVLVFQILRRVADDAAGMKTVAHANRCQPREINVRSDHAIRAQLHAFVNHGVWPDPDRGIQFCLGMNDGGRMNHEIKSDAFGLIAKFKNAARTKRLCVTAFRC